MEFLQHLWTAIVVSAVIIWIASFLLHMVLPHHKGEYKGLPDEEKFYEAIRGVPAGMYMFPWCTSMAEMKTPEFVAKQKRGPNGYVAIWSGPINFGRNLALTMLFFLVVGVFVAYLSWHALGPGPHEYMHVFRIAGTAAFMAHGLGWMPNMIWYGGSAKSFWAYLFDSLVYALLTAGTFSWLWPKGTM
jgi:hypothetical protein